ncbi:hypothetical protein F5877DRAFT_11602, partial [Lentinula edodes]
PFTVFLRNRLKYALTGRELIIYPAGFMGALSSPLRQLMSYPLKIHFRLLYDVEGRFAIHCITPEEATFKLLDFKKVAIG